MVLFIKNENIKNAGLPFQDNQAETLILRNYFQRSYFGGLRYQW